MNETQKQQPQPLKAGDIDRCKTCPFLLRVFTSVGRKRNVEEYKNRREPIEEEVQIYTWRDATLRELADLIKQVKPEAKKRGSKLVFALVYPDTRGINVMRDIGEVPSQEDNATLDKLKFEIGDFLDVTIFEQSNSRQQNNRIPSAITALSSQRSRNRY